MVYRLKEFEEHLPAYLYAIYLFKTKLLKRDIYAIQNALKRYSKKYPHISYLLVVSNTDSSHCLQRELKIKGKKGRPRTVVFGNKIDTHIHLAIIGNEQKSAYRCAKDLKKALNKHFKGNICIYEGYGKGQKAKNFINYSLKQANSVNKNGIFNEILEKQKAIDTNYL